MRTATLTRTEFGDEGTFGTLVTDSGFTCVTGELPWLDNKPNRSCIPTGTYRCEFLESPKHGWCYHVLNVPMRSSIEIHAANFMGDADKGYQCELEGCIAPGTIRGELTGQKAVLFSVAALTGLENELNQEPFELTIQYGQ